MRKSIVVMLACGLILIAGTIVWAQVTAEDTTKVTGGGWYLSDAAPTTGNRCSFGVQAHQDKTDAWTGRGSFMDRDYRLKAILTITNVTVKRPEDLLFLWGTAKVYLNNKFVANYPFRLALVDGAVSTPATDRADMVIPALGYHSHGTLSGGQITFH